MTDRGTPRAIGGGAWLAGGVLFAVFTGVAEFFLRRAEREKARARLRLDRAGDGRP